MKKRKKKSLFSNNKTRGQKEHKIKYEIVKLKLIIDYKEKFRINLLGEIVSKQNTTNLHNMCYFFQQKKALQN